MTQFQNSSTLESDALRSLRVSMAQWNALPMCTRISSQLGEILLILDELRADLQSEEASGLRWTLPSIDRIRADTDVTLRRLAS